MATSTNSCPTCRRKVRHFQYRLTCAHCKCDYHYQCVNRSRSEYENEYKDTYLCVNCLANELPFNHYYDNFDFLNALSELWYYVGEIDFRELDRRIFNPFEINDKVITNMPLCDVDPDTNFFNDMHTLNTRIVAPLHYISTCAKFEIEAHVPKSKYFFFPKALNLSNISTLSTCATMRMFRIK